MTPEDICKLESQFRLMLEYTANPRPDLELWHTDFKRNLRELNTLIAEVLTKGPMSKANVEKMTRIRELMLSANRHLPEI